MLLYIFRFFYRIRWWVIIGPLVVTLLAVWKTRNMSRTYDAEMTVYTGVVSGFGIESEQLGNQDWNILNNTLQNIINIIVSKETLKNVSLRLYARCMIYGDPNKDNNYISAEHYKQLVAITPKDVLSLIDKSSEENTIERLKKYEKPSRDNFIYGLFNWYHPHFSYNALKNVRVQRVENSDILNISYENNDPGVVYQTLDVLNDVYVKEYKTLQFGTTNNVIKYFETELARIGADLREKEDDLTSYYVQNRVINYDKQTEEVTALDRDYELRYQDILLANSSAKTAVKHLEEGLDENLKSIKSNSEFLARINKISELNYSIAEMENVTLDSLNNKSRTPYLSNLKSQLEQDEKDLKLFSSKYSNQKYTKDGYPTANFVSQWVDELLKFRKSEAGLRVLANYKNELNNLYSHFSPIGSTIKRQERGVNFTEQSYLSILASLNAARLRLKSMEMNSATLKVINPPTFPLDSKPTKRRSLVLSAAFGSLFFILGIFFIMELLDRTLRDRFRTERVTSGKVLAAFPSIMPMRKPRRFDNECRQKASHYLANQLHGYLDAQTKPCIINLLCLNVETDNQEIAEHLSSYWKDQGVGVHILREGVDFRSSSREFLFAERLSDIVDTGMPPADIYIIIHASLKDTPVPANLLREASINLLVLRADFVWKDNDQILFDTITGHSAPKPLMICLSHAEKSAVEDFTGILPPYSQFRKFAYQYYQLGFTSSKEM